MLSLSKKSKLLLGKGLKARRLAAHLSQSDLGKKLGCTGQYVFNWESGRCTPPKSKLYCLSKELDINRIKLAEIIINLVFLEVARDLKLEKKSVQLKITVLDRKNS